MVMNRKFACLVVIFIDFRLKGMKNLGLYTCNLLATVGTPSLDQSKSTKTLARTTTGN
jgi:hypothetical protein